MSTLRLLVEWLERAGHERITLVDNASTFVPLVDYLAETPHTVVRLDGNLGSRALWRAGLVPDEPFVLTDPDVLPLDDCPLAAVEYLSELLGRYPHPKAALGLYLDDTPDFKSKDWERELVLPERQLETGVFDSLADTTFAVYRAGAPFTLTALRTGWPYQARHVCPAWYGGDLSDEDRFYLEHANRTDDGALVNGLGSSWALGLQ